MRILLVHLLETHSLASDGVATHLRNLARGLERAGHETKLVSFAEVSPDFRAAYRRAVAEAYRENAGRGLQETFRRRRDLVGELVRLELARWRPDAVLAQGPLEASAVPEGVAPVVLTLHAFRSADELRKGRLAAGSPEHAWFVGEEDRALAAAAGLVAVSQEYLDEARRRGAQPACARLVPNGIDLAAYAAARERREATGLAGRTVIGVLGRLSRQKGQDVLLRAFAGCRSRLPETVLLIGGEGECREEYVRLAEELQLGESVRWLGEIRDVPDFLRLLDLAILPSRWEGLPFALLEYGAAGLPVIASRVGGVPELITEGDTGRLVPPEDAEALGRALGAALAERATGRRLGEALRRKVAATHSIETMAAGYLAVIDETIRAGVTRRPAPAPRLPSFSVIIPNYNHAQFLPAALQAILDQDHPADEIIVVDDASMDESVRVLDEWRSRLPRLRYLRQEKNQGPLAACNRGLAECRSDYVFLQAADDFMLPGFIRKNLEALARHPEAALAVSEPAMLDDLTGELGGVRYGWSEMEKFILPRELGPLMRGFNLGGANSVMKRELIMNMGGYPEWPLWFSDWLLTNLLALRHGVVYLPEVLMVARTDRDDSYSVRGQRRKRENRRVIASLLRHLVSPECADVYRGFLAADLFSTLGRDLAPAFLETPSLWRPAALRLLQPELERELKRAREAWR